MNASVRTHFHTSRTQSLASVQQIRRRPPHRCLFAPSVGRSNRPAPSSMPPYVLPGEGARCSFHIKGRPLCTAGPPAIHFPPPRVSSVVENDRFARRPSCKLLRSTLLRPQRPGTTCGLGVGWTVVQSLPLNSCCCGRPSVCSDAHCLFADLFFSN
eukprot:GGOE01030252.1.p1 GENE.GGOE01030252.1~~GGOE01030252.1.p1  ORF type:complete len:156 (+),score=1.18 GGOE01030252.1:650-1117(+)